MSKDAGDHAETSNGGEYFDALLVSLGFQGNVQASKTIGVSEGMISKWRNGKAQPTPSNITKIYNALAPIAQQRGIPIDTAAFYVKWGALSESALDSPVIDPLYVELDKLDRLARDVSREEQQNLRQHVKVLIQVTRERLDSSDREHKKRGA